MGLLVKPINKQQITTSSYGNRFSVWILSSAYDASTIKIDLYGAYVLKVILRYTGDLPLERPWKLVPLFLNRVRATIIVISIFDPSSTILLEYSSILPLTSPYTEYS